MTSSCGVTTFLSSSRFITDTGYSYHSKRRITHQDENSFFLNHIVCIGDVTNPLVGIFQQGTYLFLMAAELHEMMLISFHTLKLST